MTNFADLIFSVFNTWHMAILCLIMTMISYCKIKMYPDKWNVLSAKLRTLNWFLFSVVWLYVSMGDISILTLRALLRFSVAFLIISEIGYNYWVIRNMISRCMIYVPRSLLRK